MQSANPLRTRSQPEITLILPTYNAAPFLAQTWQAILALLERVGDQWEILFVCDGCRDTSADSLTRWAAPYQDRIRVLSYHPNRGKGYAVRTGLSEARGQWCLFTDVDLAYGFDEIERVAEALRRGAQVAIASRVHPESRLLLPSGLEGYAYRRYLQSLVFSRVVRQFLPIPQRDTQAGLKGLSAGAVEHLLPLLRCNGFAFDCELLTACQVAGFPVVEIPVLVRHEGRTSTTSMKSMGRMLRDIWKIRRRLRAGAFHRSPLPFAPWPAPSPSRAAG